MKDLNDPSVIQLAEILPAAMYAKGYQNPKLFAVEIIKRLPPGWPGIEWRQTEHGIEVGMPGSTPLLIHVCHEAENAHLQKIKSGYICKICKKQIWMCTGCMNAIFKRDSMQIASAAQLDWMDQHGRKYDR